MKTETVEIKNGAGTYRKVIKGLTTVNVRIPPEQIEGQELRDAWLSLPAWECHKESKWTCPDGLYEMEKVEKPIVEDFSRGPAGSIQYNKALTDYRPWRIIKLLDKQYYLTAGEKRKLMKWAKLLDK